MNLGSGFGIVTFSQVDVAGTFTYNYLTNTSQGYVPISSNYVLSNQTMPPSYWALSTTATYSGTIRVCINSQVAPFYSLLHYQSPPGVWQNVTTDLVQQFFGGFLVCGSVTSLSPFALGAAGELTASGASDPHLVGANGVEFEFDGQSEGIYTLFSSPQFHLEMQLSDDDGPSTRYMTNVGLMFREEDFFFDTDEMQESFRDDLQKRLERAGGKLLSWSSWQVKIELCPQQIVTISQMHSTKPWLSHADGSPWFYLDVNITVPGCHDSFDGALGRTYNCKYFTGQEEFKWSHEQEEKFRVPTLLTMTGAFQADAPCDAEYDGSTPPAAAKRVGGGKAQQLQSQLSSSSSSSFLEEKESG
jgi:hypothetical protein